MTDTIATPSGRKLRLRTRTVDQCFAMIGQVVARNGRVVAETDVVPYGFYDSALRQARELAEKLA